jgi:hypothetical protein
MKTSETIAKIAPALLKAQKSITFASKDSLNPHFKSKYADLGSVIEAVKPALNDSGIAFVQTTGTSDPGILAMTTRLLHESGEWMEDTATCPLPKNDPQGYGSACTYLRRYSLAAIVGLYQDDDDGNGASGKDKEKKATPDPVGKAALESCASLDSLQSTWTNLTPSQRTSLGPVKDAMKLKITAADERAATV